MNNEQLTLFYDGHCPLCSLEMQRLKEHDKNNKIFLIDLHDTNFNEQYPQINIDRALAILHGEYQGKLLLGLDVTHRAWTLVGKGWLVAPLQWPIIKPISHQAYLILAKYRYPISQFMHKRLGIGLQTCNEGTCYEKPNKLDHRGE